MSAVTHINKYLFPKFLGTSETDMNQVLSKYIKTKQKQPPEVFYKKGVLRNFVKFTGKHLCQSLFFNKVAGLMSATLLKKKL